MKIAPKVLLGIALLLTAILIFLIQNLQKTTQIKIEAYQDYFKVAFDIPKKDQGKVQKSTEALNLPQNILEGFEFELDSTSSARLAFATPITINLNFKTEEVNFSGEMAVSQPINLKINPSLKIPQNTNIGFYAQNFNKFILILLENPELVKWYEQNFTNPGQYLISFGQNSYVIVSTKSEPASFHELQQLSTEVNDQSYKQESFNLASGKTVDLHILKLPTFFQLGENLYFASSPQTAKDFINAQIGNAPAVTFWDTNLKGVSFAAFWQRQETSSQEDLKQVLGGAQNIAKYLTNIERASVIQNGDKFEGTIKFKSD